MPKYTAFLSARIYTGDPGGGRAEAVLIKDNTIAALGTDREIRDLCPADTEKVFMDGGFITPGFVDAHTHLWSMGHTLTMVDLRGVTSLKACQAAISKKAETVPPGQWILGRNWNQNIWEEKRDPTRHDLDAACPDHPAVMIRICGHANWANTRAFELAGVGPDTPEPFGGKIDREPETNMPAGVVRETREVVEDAVPVPDTAMRKQAFLDSQEIFLRHGITCVHSFETLRDYQVVREVEKDGDLKLRVYHTVHEDEVDAFDRWQRNNPPQTDMLWHGHIKMFADGSLGARSAYLHAPYEGSPDNCGICCMTPDQMLKNVKQAYGKGRGVIFHAIGDRALTQSLDAIEAARKEFPGEHRDRIEHVQLARPADLERMKRLDIAASVQPMAIQTDWSVAGEIWGGDRCRNSYAWKTMAGLGLRMIFSSDAPIEPVSPMAGIQSAVTRKGINGGPDLPWFPDQCLDLDTALTAYFSHAGWATGRDELFGSLAPGKRADMTILENDPFTVPPEEISRIRVKMTVVDGRIVYKTP